MELTRQTWAQGGPSISADGRWIAFHAKEHENDKTRIAIMPFEGGEPARWIEAPDDFGIGEYFSPLAWSPDGSALYCVRTIHGVGNLWRLPLAGGPSKQVTNFGESLMMEFAWSPDGRKLAVVRGNMTSDVVLLSGFRF